MSTQTTKLSERARQSLQKLVSGKAPAAGEDEVVVVVLGRHEAFVSRTKVSGLRVSSRELSVRLAGAEIAVKRLAASAPAAPPPQLTAQEATLLGRAGARESRSDGPGALERSRIELEILLRESSSVKEAAKVLGVTTGRLRQRLTQRTLYGIKERDGWRLPRFQFDSNRKGKLVRGIEKVLPWVRPDAHPLAVEKWFSTPHQDLVTGDDEQRVTPLAWLSAGNPSEDVAELAKEI